MGKRYENQSRPVALTGGVYVSTAGVAELVGVGSNTVRHWLVAARRDPQPDSLPAPDAIFGQTPIWLVDRIAAWCENTGRTCRAVS